MSSQCLPACYLQQSCPSDYIRDIHPTFIIIFRYKTHRSHHGLIKRASQTPSLLTLSPFPLFLHDHWRSPLPFCLLFLFLSFSISWAMLAVTISFCNLDFIGCHVFDVRSGHIYFQGQYSLHFFPFVCNIFLVLFFALVVFLSNPFLVILFLQPLLGFQSYKGVSKGRYTRGVLLPEHAPGSFFTCQYWSVFKFAQFSPGACSQIYNRLNIVEHFTGWKFCSRG